MKDKKTVAISLIILIVISLGLGITGFLLNKNLEKKPSKDPEVEYNVTLVYYLDGEEVETMPMNPTPTSSTASTSEDEYNVESRYEFYTVSCTNNIVGSFDEETWEFSHNNSADGTCKLYFVSRFNKLTYKTENAEVKALKSNMIKRGSDAILELTPKEGYIYKETNCTNNEKVKWNEEKKELTVEKIEKETECEIKFALAKYTVEIRVENGEGATKLIDKDYGSKIETTVKASANYGNPTITCTENIAGTWSNDKFVIEKLTNNTVCTISFKQTQTETFSAELELGNCAKISSGTNPQAGIVKGGSAVFTIEINEGYSYNGFTCTVGSINDKINQNGTRTITINNVTANSKCTIICDTTQ